MSELVPVLPVGQLKKMDAPDGEVYFIRMPFCWGRSKNAYKAYKRARENLFTDPPYNVSIVRIVDEDVTIYDSGEIRSDHPIKLVGEYRIPR